MVEWTEHEPPEGQYQVLDAEGALDGDPPEFEEDELVGMYRTMVATRTLEEKMLNMQRSGEASLIARSLGEEATPLGCAAALAPDDWVFYTYRQNPALLYWDYPMAHIIASTMGAEPETMNEHLGDLDAEVNFSPDYTPVGVNTTNAVGMAMADKFNDRETVSMAFIGDGSTSEGSFHDAMNFAGVFEPPVVIVCQNNQWAISEPSHRQTGSETFAQKGEAYGIPHERVDGNDIFAVREKAEEAVERARNGDGPTFIECVTYRMEEHNTSDNPDVYRDPEEQREEWAERDPLDRYETYLREEGVLDDDLAEEIEAELDEEVSAAVEAARGVPDSEPERMFDHHLHGDSWAQAHQRKELEREQSGKNPFTDFTGEGFDE
ncbi:thiamine pyrophosphate-dependent dehydrogenase E1 component subunit alpha [Halococcus hamelinensis]|uniref:2-oxo acid dehydrogenase E1 component alpha subunit n=1 Tax=Halococcus hamelinensis 100A6 TaxID=1132509 RepID=M0M6Z7_9EURY|nr:thiamine pyrophosphate-dependent enzyme [Halococcus hamelinensis]EMA41481.1 2-oxo acid dehydrogenase E1 component alpha subunit [Halococcus hamelinensis 100A6]